MLSIDWSAIRPLQGSQASGFEELCAQLARAEHPRGFVRKGTPDAGLECYAADEDGTEWGWQAKYFFGLGDSQWAQLDESVRNALDKHPALVRFVACLPYDRPDARIVGQKSALQKWGERVSKWEEWARQRGMAVEFAYRGSSELLEILQRPEHAGRVRFWFDAAAFDPAWFGARLEESLRSAGPRYTPELHVELDLAEEFEAFGRTERFFGTVASLAKELRSEKVYAPDDASAELHAKLTELSSAVAFLRDGILSVRSQAADALPLAELADGAAAATQACDDTERLLEPAAGGPAKRPASQDPAGPGRRTARETRSDLRRLSRVLRKTRAALAHASELAESRLLVLSGRAGSGKTHLVCDIAGSRLAHGRPTVLLMGQRFLTADDPWAQALRQLDLASLSADEFVGALEAAAQASDCRALLVLDAVNEGQGRAIWPANMEPFLARLERSPWIGVVVTVRDSYLEAVLPESVRARGSSLYHEGFGDRQYDALKSFFSHFGLELPSSPLLDPEFSNPLFLLTVCKGLQGTGQRRLPRGFHGISVLFQLRLEAAQRSLASSLSFNPSVPYVARALEAFAGELARRGTRWIAVDDAEALVGAKLPGRAYHDSLYKGLLDEGLLVEDARATEVGHEVVAYVGYERFADHLVAKSLLDAHMDPDRPDAAFSEGGALAYVSDPGTYVPSGLLEALSVQVPERTRRELVDLAPASAERWGAGDALRRSLVWRSPDSFSEATLDAVNRMIRRQEDFYETLDALISLATVPDHPYNADFLDGWLRKRSMPDRDKAWSTYLHRAWEEGGPLKRTVDWAWELPNDRVTDDADSLRLCATVLAWTLTASNRFLRDRATKALVNLLTDRLAEAESLLRRFHRVDDPYVAERLYAVAYGIAMRSPNSGAVGGLARAVYKLVFQDGAPPAHVLLRDYARGTCERAIELGSGGGIDPSKIRPPYPSQWPRIPTQEEVAAMKAGWPDAAYDGGDPEWARRRIAWSVESDDFARYVIGTNGGYNGWLSVRLDEPAWKSPEERLEELVSGFPEGEREVCEAVLEALREEPVTYSLSHFTDDELEVAYGEALSGAEPEPEEEAEPGNPLEGMLEPGRLEAFTSLLEESRDWDLRRPPGFDLSLVQRYVLWRVFDLGWTVDRFGAFDRLVAGNDGREARKAERIGKKYQWIAYHEIMAYVADHFRLRERFGDEEERDYSGPWQEGLRDIDPSCVLRSTPGSTSWEGHDAAWWGSEHYGRWDPEGDPGEWTARTEDLPRVEGLLRSERPGDGSRWLNLDGYFNWKQATPEGRESTELDRREVWFIVVGYLVRRDDAAAFMEWAHTVSFWGRWMPDPLEDYETFLGEHGWSAASGELSRSGAEGGWISPDKGCPTKVCVAAFEYLKEAPGFDCSVDETYRLRLPDNELMAILRVRWAGRASGFVDTDGETVAYDPTDSQPGPTALLVSQDKLMAALEREGLALCWAVLGEKRVLPAGYERRGGSAMELSGAYMLTDDGRIEGFLNPTIRNWD